MVCSYCVILWTLLLQTLLICMQNVFLLRILLHIQFLMLTIIMTLFTELHSKGQNKTLCIMSLLFYDANASFCPLPYSLIFSLSLLIINRCTFFSTLVVIPNNQKLKFNLLFFSILPNSVNHDWSPTKLQSAMNIGRGEKELSIFLILLLAISLISYSVEVVLNFVSVFL